MASVDDVVALALPTLYWSGTCGTSGVSGLRRSSAGGKGRCFLEPPKDQDRPDLRKDVGRGVDWVILSVIVFLWFASFQSSWPLRSAEDGVVEALLCREELSVELVFAVL